MSLANWSLVNARQLISNALSNDTFSPIWLTEKRREDLNRIWLVKARANSFKVTLFSLWLNLIIFYLLRVCVITNAEKVNNWNRDATNMDKLSINRADSDKINETETNRADQLGTNIANWAEVDKMYKPNRNILESAKTGGANKLA